MRILFISKLILKYDIFFIQAFEHLQIFQAAMVQLGIATSLETTSMNSQWKWWLSVVTH